MKIKLDEALQIARSFIGQIEDTCERIEIAGSVRRIKAEVKDIEIVAIPKLIYGYPATLDGSSLVDPDTNTLHEKLKDMRDKYLIFSDRFSKDHRKPPFGLRYYRISWAVEKIPLDLFVVLPPADWGVIFAIRTGPSDLSFKLVTSALKQGLKVQDGQLFKLKNMNPDHNNKWVLGEKIPCPEETDFFKALGYRKVPEPQERR